MEFNYIETLAKIFITTTRYDHENIFDNAPHRRIAIAMITNSVFTESYTENPFGFQETKLRQNRIFRGGQPIVDFDAADTRRRYVMTMKAASFQVDVPSVPIVIFTDHYVLVLD